MAVEKITLKYNGRSDLVSVHVLPNVAYMEDRLRPPPEDLKNVVSVSCDPGSKVVTYKMKDGSELKYDPDADPANFIIDWRLHNTALLKDQVYDGAKLSDYSYWTQQARNYRASVTWGLINKLGMNRKLANRWANRGVAIFQEELFLKRGLDLNRPMTQEEIDNDRSISEKQAAREFQNAQTLK